MHRMGFCLKNVGLFFLRRVITMNRRTAEMFSFKAGHKGPSAFARTLLSASNERERYSEQAWHYASIREFTHSIF